MALEKESETYQRELPALQAHEGKFMLIQGDGVVDVFDSYEDAVKDGYNRFGVDTPFMVKQILTVERIQYMTRDITFPCRT